VWSLSSRPLILALLLCSLAANGAGRPRVLTLPLQVRVARCGGKPVRREAWVKEHLEAARRVLAPQGIRLAATRDSFRPARCVLLDRAQRHALAEHVDPARVTVLVVERARDLELTSYDLMGVHWRYRGDDSRYQGRRWVILTARARPPVLAHELAHYLGLPHDPAGGNLMTPGPSAPIWRGSGAKPKPFAPLLTDAQGERLRAAVRRLLKGAAAAGAPLRGRPR